MCSFLRATKHKSSHDSYPYTPAGSKHIDTHFNLFSMCVLNQHEISKLWFNNRPVALSHTHTHTPTHSLIQPTESLHWYKSSPRRHSQENFSHFSLNVWTFTAVDFCPLISYTQSHTNTHTHTHTHTGCLCLSISCPLILSPKSASSFFFISSSTLHPSLSLSARLVRYDRLLLRASTLARNILFFHENPHHLIIIFQTFTHASLSESQSFPCQHFVGFDFDLSPPYRPQ